MTERSEGTIKHSTTGRSGAERQRGEAVTERSEGTIKRHPSGILDTCAYLDLEALEPESLPEIPEITAITLAELTQGVAMAKDGATRATRSEQLGAAIVEFDALPFDQDAATRYGSLVALTLAAKRDPKPRRMDLLIAAIASSRELPLFTRNGKDFRGLESMLEIVPI